MNATFPQFVHQPDWQRRVSSIPPILGWTNVHAPQLPAVSMGGIFIPLNFKGILLDVVNRRKDDPFPIFLDARENWLSPKRESKAKCFKGRSEVKCKRKHTQKHIYGIQMFLRRSGFETQEPQWRQRVNRAVGRSKWFAGDCQSFPGSKSWTIPSLK